MSVYMWNTFCLTLFGTGASKETGAQAKMLGMNKVMVCTEKALCDFGVATQVVDALHDTSQPLKTHTGVDVFLCKRRIVAIAIGIKL